MSTVSSNFAEALFLSKFTASSRLRSCLPSNALFDFIFFFPGVVALAFYGYEYAALAWKIKETSWSSPAQIQIYMVKTMIPAAGTLLVIQGIAEVFRSLICIRTGQWPARMVVAEETEQMLMRTSQELSLIHI